MSDQGNLALRRISPHLAGRVCAALALWLVLVGPASDLAGGGRQEYLAALGRTWLALRDQGYLMKFVQGYPNLGDALLAITTAPFPADWSDPIAQSFTRLLALMQVALWYRSLLRSWPAPLAVLLASVLAVHPFFLAAPDGGLSWILLNAAAFGIARGLLRLDGKLEVKGIVVSALSMALAVLAHPAGILLVFAALPALVLAAPPDRKVSSPFSILFTILFPVAFALGACAFVNSVAAGSAAEVFRMPAGAIGQSSLSDASLFGGGRDVTLSLAGFTCIVPPVLLCLRSDVSTYRCLRVIAVAGMAPIALVLGWQAGFMPDPLRLAGLAVPVAAAVFGHELPARAFGRVLVGSLIATAATWTAMAWLAGYVLDGGRLSERHTQSGSQRVRAGPSANDAVLEALAGKGRVLADLRRDPEFAGSAIRAGVEFLPERDTGKVLAQIAAGRACGIGAFAVWRDTVTGEADAVARGLPALSNQAPRHFRRVFESGDWRIYARDRSAGGCHSRVRGV